MSEFECINGHLMGSGQFTCRICGGRLYRMDGMTANELRAQERYYHSHDEEADEPEEEKEDE